MTEKSMDTSLTSDVMIYNALIRAKKDNSLLQQFEISYPFDGALATESNTIFVANVSDELTKQTFNSEHYNALTEIFVKTKQTDYTKASLILRTIIKVIKQILREDEELKLLDPVFRSSASNYGSKYALKGRNLLVLTKEADLFDVPSDEITRVCKMIVQTNKEDLND